MSMKVTKEQFVGVTYEELLDENAKLRDGAAKMAQWYDEELKAALAENAKLRELVRHLYECAKHNTCAVCDYAEDACDFKYDMRELGIEASE